MESKSCTWVDCMNPLRRKDPLSLCWPSLAEGPGLKSSDGAKEIHQARITAHATRAVCQIALRLLPDRSSHSIISTPTNDFNGLLAASLLQALQLPCHCQRTPLLQDCSGLQGGFLRIRVDAQAREARPQRRRQSVAKTSSAHT